MEASTSNTVQLGCGTLILIAIIVLIFSKIGNDEIEAKLDSIDRRLDRIETHLGTGSGPPLTDSGLSPGGDPAPPTVEETSDEEDAPGAG